MKHLLLILFVAILGYVFLNMADKQTRAAVKKFIGFHGLALGALLTFIAAGVYLAVNLSSTKLF